MLFSPNPSTLQARHAERDAAVPFFPTIATPTWFAPPIDAKETEDAVTISFFVASEHSEKLRVEASGKNVFIWGAMSDEGTQERPMRVLAVPFDISTQDIHTSRNDDILRVCIAKRVIRASRDTSARAA